MISVGTYMELQQIVIYRDYYGKPVIKNGYLIDDNQVSIILYDVDTHKVTRVIKHTSPGSLWQETYNATVQDLELMWRRTFHQYRKDKDKLEGIWK